MVAQVHRGLGLVGALAAGVLLACPWQLPRGVSCGDGWWDPEHEECDPSDPTGAYIEACREQGWAIDARCDSSCRLLASEADCTVCGDGVISGGEECDGNKLGGATCADGSRQARCRDDCTLDLQDCPGDCGDGAINGNEECDYTMGPCTEADCPEGTACLVDYGCVALDAEGQPDISCSAYPNTAVDIALKSYASGTISECTERCDYGRNRCGFCGDGVLDDSYWDHTYPSGELVEMLEEVCDGRQARDKPLHDHCESQCGANRDFPRALAPGVKLSCEFDCLADCSGFDVDSILGEPSGCCLRSGSPCPPDIDHGVPDLPCCSWFDGIEGCVPGPGGQVCW